MGMRIAMLAAALAGAALAQQPAPPTSAFAAANLSPKGVAAMATACAMCHGSEGVPVAGSTVAPLAGRPNPDEDHRARCAPGHRCAGGRIRGSWLVTSAW